MYTRNFGKQKYTPPPGYDGTAFNDMVTTKHHVPTEMIRSEETSHKILYEVPEEENIVQEIGHEKNEEAAIKPVPKKEEKQIGQLLEMLRGKLGAEEMIILLIILLIASEGVSAEMLVLGILLLV